MTDAALLSRIFSTGLCIRYALGLSLAVGLMSTGLSPGLVMVVVMALVVDVFRLAMLWGLLSTPTAAATGTILNTGKLFDAWYAAVQLACWAVIVWNGVSVMVHTAWFLGLHMLCVGLAGLAAEAALLVLIHTGQHAALVTAVTKMNVTAVPDAEDDAVVCKFVVAAAAAK